MADPKAIVPTVLLFAASILATVTLSGQAPAPNPAASPTSLVMTGVTVKDNDGQFVPGLRLEDFEIREDDVAQKIVLFRAMIGGRPVASVAPASPAPTAGVASTPGVVLPLQPTPKAEMSRRAFIIFIDETHFAAVETPKVRDVLRLVRDNLIRDTDLVGFISTGPSAVAMNPTYDGNSRRFDGVIDRIMGSGPSLENYANPAFRAGQQASAGLSRTTSDAFAAAYNMVEQLATVNLPKTLIYVSDGYFDPFDSTQPNAAYRAGPMWNEAEFVAASAELARAARRANVVIDPIDPRGAIAGVPNGLVSSDARQVLDRQAQSLEVLAGQTGGIVYVGTNDFLASIRRVDGQTTNLYTLGYYSTNPDLFKIQRGIAITVPSHPALTLEYNPVYTLPRPR